MRKFALLTLVVLSLAGMSCLKLPPQEATKQNLRNWELFAPAHKAYLNADEALPGSSKRIRIRALGDAVSLARKLTGEGDDD